MVGATASVSGTPTQAGTFRFTVTATDTRGATGSVQYDVTIAPAPVTIVVGPLSLPDGVVGTSYSQTFTAVGGTGASTFAATTGTLPAGLSLNPTTGILSGTPTTAGTSNFTITATDTATNATGNRPYALTITAAPTPTPQISLSPRVLPDGTVGAAYTQTLTALGGVGPPYTQSITAGTLPPGLSFTAGLISGTASAAGAFTFTVTATDTAANTGSQAYTVTIIAAAPVTIVLAPLSLPNGVVGTGYSQTITAAGGTGPHTFAVTAGTLPAGLSLTAATGVLSGTPSTAGTSNFTITATDTATNATGNRPYALTITATPTPQISLSPRALPDGTVGAAYTQTLTALGGVGPPYTQSITAGTLPPGLSFTAGLISGTASAAGAFAFTVTATDTATNTGSQAYTVTIAGTSPTPTPPTPTPITIAPATLPNGTVGVGYSEPVIAAGGVPPYKGSVTGTVPLD